MKELIVKKKKSTIAIVLSVILAGFGVVNPEMIPMVVDVVDSVVQLAGTQ